MSSEETNNKQNAAITGPLKVLTSVIEEHEKALRAMTIFRDVSYTYKKWDLTDEQGDPTGHEETLFLGIRKWNGSWRLCHGSYCSADPSGDVDWKPLADSSVADRLSAVPHIDKLRQAILDDKQKLSGEIEAVFLTAINALENYPDGAERAQAVRSGLLALVDETEKKGKPRA